MKINSFSFGGKVSKDCIVNTTNGIKRISELSESNFGKIESSSGTLPILNSKYFYTNNNRIIRTYYGYQLLCEGNTEILVLTPYGLHWKRAEDIKPNKDYIVLSRGKKICSDKDVIIHFNNDYNNSFIFPKRMNKDLACFLGLMVGDGCGNRGIACGIDKDLGNFILELVPSLFPHLKVHLEKRKAKNVDYSQIAKFQLASTTHNRNKLLFSFRDFLSYVGYINYDNTIRTDSYRKRIPWSILSSSKESIKAFILGLFEADGYITPTGSEYYTASTYLHDQVKYLLLNFGIVTHSIQSCLRKNPFTQKVNRIPSNLLMFFSNDIDIFMKEFGVISNRKQKRFKKAIKRNTNLDTIPYVQNKMDLYKSQKIKVDGGYSYLSSRHTQISLPLGAGLASCKGYTFSAIQKGYIKLESLKQIDPEYYQQLNFIVNNHFYLDKVTKKKRVDDEIKMYNIMTPIEGNTFERGSFVANGFIIRNI